MLINVNLKYLYDTKLIFKDSMLNVLQRVISEKTCPKIVSEMSFIIMFCLYVLCIVYGYITFLTTYSLLYFV